VRVSAALRHLGHYLIDIEQLLLYKTASGLLESWVLRKAKNMKRILFPASLAPSLQIGREINAALMCGR
jgi:hypothetical protein